MAVTINARGTSVSTFGIGKNKLTLDATNLTTSRSWIFPDSNGTSGQVLSTDGSGNLTWTTSSGSGTVTSVTVDTSGVGISSSGSPITTSGTITITSNATSANTASTLVSRDGSGNFSAGTITSSLTGAASLNVLKAGDTMSGPLKIYGDAAALSTFGIGISTSSATGGYHSSLKFGNDTDSSGALFIKTRGATQTDTTAILTDDFLGILVFAGSDGTTIRNDGVYISAQSDGNWNSTDRPASLGFSTRAPGQTPSRRFTITSTGAFALGSTKITGTAGQVLTSAGSGTIPTWTTPGESTTVNINGITNISAATFTSAVTTPNQVVMSLSSSTYRSVKYQIQIATAAAFETLEILLIHDGTTPSITEYARIATGAALATIDADISGGNIRLLTTLASAISTTIKVAAISLTT